MKPITDNNLSITLTVGNDTQMTTTIQSAALNEGRRTLGVRLAPDGSDTAEYEFHLQQANALVHRLSRAALTREEVTIGFHSLWNPAIGYSLPTKCFLPEQCAKLQGRFMPLFASSRMGLN